MSYTRSALFALVLVNTPVFAQPLVSPYTDLTLNVHWDSETSSLEPMDWASVASKQAIKAFHLAFVTDAGNCKAAWGGIDQYGFDTPFAKKLTAAFKTQDIETTVSFGGATGNDLSMNCSEDQLVSVFDKALSLFAAKALDFDVENGSADVPKLMHALKTFQAKNPSTPLSFTLPTMPEGLTWQGKDLVNQAKEAGLNFSVNIMAMDYGPAYALNMGTYAIDAANNLHLYLKSIYPEASDQALWNRIRITPMIGVNDVNVEEFTLNDADTLKQFADKTGAFLSMWSINRDQPCKDKNASPTCSGNQLQVIPYEFFMHLAAL